MGGIAVDKKEHSPFAVDIIFLMALAVASSDFGALMIELPKNLTGNISRSVIPLSFSSSKFSDKSVSFVADAQSSPTSVQNLKQTIQSEK